MEEEASLSDYLKVLYKGKKLILGSIFGITSLAILISFFLTSTYKAEASILPIGGGSQTGISMAINQMGLGGVMGAFEDSLDLGEELMVIVSSRTMSEKLIKRFNLMEVFYGKQSRDLERQIPMEKVVEKFHERVFVQRNRLNKVILITAVMNDPKLAADVANGIVEELEAYLKNSYLTSAKKKRIFVEDQLERNRVDLLNAGQELLALYDRRNVSDVAATVNVDVSVDDSSREGGQVLSDKNKQLNSDGKTISSGPDPSGGFPGIPSAFAMVQERVGELQVRAGELKEKIREAKIVKNVPQQVYLHFLILHKKLLSEINQLLTRQSELARIEETKEELSFQVIDQARVPVGRYKPNRKFIAISTFAASLLGSVFLVFLLEHLRERRSEKEAR